VYRSPITDRLSVRLSSQWRASSGGAYGAIKACPCAITVAARAVRHRRWEPLLDLCYEEDSHADVDMNLVLTGRASSSRSRRTAEQTAFDDAGWRV